jgi:hypothetical protein
MTEKLTLREFIDFAKTIDFNNISLENLVKFEDGVSQYENIIKPDTLAILKKRIIDKYIYFQNTKNIFRENIHKIRTGYKKQDWGRDVPIEDAIKLTKRRINRWNPDRGWKFHLDVVPNRDHPITKKVSEFLLDLNVEHKIGSGGENGKGMTVYVGSYKDTCNLAHLIQERFGKDIYEPPTYTDQVAEEHAFEPTVYGRFVTGYLGDYPSDGIGISPLYMLPSDYKKFMFDNAQKKAFDLGLINDPEKTAFIGNKLTAYKFYNTERNIVWLRHYCSHKLYAEALGEYYCGNNIDAFEDAFFKDKLPPKGSDQRQKWDEVAKVFVEESKAYTYGDKKLLDWFKSFKDGYIPLNLHETTPTKTTEINPILLETLQKKK